MSGLHKMEYYLATKKKGSFDICYNMDEPWEKMMASEITQTGKDKYCMTLLLCLTLSSPIHRDRMVVARVWGLGAVGR